MQDPQDPKSKKIDLRAKASWVFSPDATLAIGLRPDFEGMIATIKEHYGKPEDDKAWFAVMKKYGVDAKALPNEYKVHPDATTAMIADELLLRAVKRMETDYLHGRRGAEMTVESKPDTQLPLPFMGTKAQRAIMDQYGAFLNPNNKLRFVQNEEFAMQVPGKLADVYPPTRLMDELTSEKVRMAYEEALDEWKLEYTPRGKPLETLNSKESGGYSDATNKLINVVTRHGPKQTGKAIIHETQHALQTINDAGDRNELKKSGLFTLEQENEQRLRQNLLVRNALQQGRNPLVLTNEEDPHPFPNIKRYDKIESTLKTPSEQDLKLLEVNKQQQISIRNEIAKLEQKAQEAYNDTSLRETRRIEKYNELLREQNPLWQQITQLQLEEDNLKGSKDIDVLKLLSLDNYKYITDEKDIGQPNWSAHQLTGLGMMVTQDKPTPEQILNTLIYENSWIEREARFAESSDWDAYAPGHRFGTLSRQLLQRF